LRAVQVAQFGVEYVRLAEAADPVPGAGEVLIRTEAATINPADLGIVTGAAVPRFPPGTAAPYTPGWDLAGRVVSRSEGTDPALAGARVVGFTIWFVTGHGTQASLVALPASNVVVAPESLPSTQLTTVGLNGLTAWRGLADLNLTAGETLVVTGAARQDGAQLHLRAVSCPPARFAGSPGARGRLCAAAAAVGCCAYGPDRQRLHGVGAGSNELRGEAARAPLLSSRGAAS